MEKSAPLKKFSTVVYSWAMPTSLITAAQAGEILGVTRHRVIQLITAGRLPAEKVGMQYLIKPADLEKVKDRKPGRPVTTGAGQRRRRGGKA